LRDGGCPGAVLNAVDFEYECCYSILESPMHIANYGRDAKLHSVTTGDSTFAEWSAEFDCDADRERELTAEHRAGVFQLFFFRFDALKQYASLGVIRPQASPKRRGAEEAEMQRNQNPRT
jgi:hypothetical protein